MRIAAPVASSAARHRERSAGELRADHHLDERQLAGVGDLDARGLALGERERLLDLAQSLGGNAVLRSAAIASSRSAEPSLTS